MTIYYCSSQEEALRYAKKAGKMPGCTYKGIKLKSGSLGFAVYKEGEIVAQYIGRNVKNG